MNPDYQETEGWVKVEPCHKCLQSIFDFYITIFSIKEQTDGFHLHIQTYLMINHSRTRDLNSSQCLLSLAMASNKVYFSAQFRNQQETSENKPKYRRLCLTSPANNYSLGKDPESRDTIKVALHRHRKWIPCPLRLFVFLRLCPYEANPETVSSEHGN